MRLLSWSREPLEGAAIARYAVIRGEYSLFRAGGGCAEALLVQVNTRNQRHVGSGRTCVRSVVLRMRLCNSPEAVRGFASRVLRLRLRGLGSALALIQWSSGTRTVRTCLLITVPYFESWSAFKIVHVYAFKVSCDASSRTGRADLLTFLVHVPRSHPRGLRLITLLQHERALSIALVQVSTLAVCLA